MKKMMVVLASLSCLHAYAEFPDEAVITDIQKKEIAIETREKNIKKKEEELIAREKAVIVELKKIEEIKKRIEFLEGEGAKKGEEKVSRLVETLEGMSPKTSSLVLTKVNDDLAVLALSKMSTAKVSKIMNQMDVSKSSRLMELMTQGRRANHVGENAGTADEQSNSERKPANK